MPWRWRETGAESESFYNIGLVRVYFITPFFQTLGGKEEKGGVIIFVTDGKFNCKPEDGDDSQIDDPEIIKEIKDREVRVVTIAFG